MKRLGEFNAVSVWELTANHQVQWSSCVVCVWVRSANTMTMRASVRCTISFLHITRMCALQQDQISILFLFFISAVVVFHVYCVSYFFF
jgi:hypothetical protein